MEDYWLDYIGHCWGRIKFHAIANSRYASKDAYDYYWRQLELTESFLPVGYYGA